MAQALRARFEVTTPLFMSGANQINSELRAASLRGLLRFWYRAADPKYTDREAFVFGGIDKTSGQSAVLLRLDAVTPSKRPTFAEYNPRRFDQGRGKDTRNGLIYLGYPFQMGDNASRQSIPPGYTFTLRALLPRVTDAASERALIVRRALVASLWLLGHFGGAGSRSRRGFGGLTLTGWEPDTTLPNGDASWPELDALPLAVNTSAPDEARRALSQGLETLRTWFGDDWGQAALHPHLGAKLKFEVLSAGVKKAEWDRGLADLGQRMQRFRGEMASSDRGDNGTQTPARASFGLPLTFRYPSKQITFVPVDEVGGGSFERHGSLLLLRLLRVGETLHPLITRLDGAVPGERPKATIRGSKRPLRVAAGNAMDAFFASLSKAGGL